MNKFLDTNAVLQFHNRLDEIGFFYLSSITLYELEDIKTNERKTSELRYQARHVNKWLRNNEDKYCIVQYTDVCRSILDLKGVEITPDAKIISCAATLDDVVVVTDDNACANIAKNIFNLPIEYVQNEKESFYKGYKELVGTTEYINEKIEEYENSNYDDWNVNEYIIIHNIDDDSVKEMRFDGEKFVPLKLPNSKYIKAKNSLQRCALDLLNNPDITICAILGGYGSGKTALTTKMSIYQVQEKGCQSKIDVIREPKGEGDSVGWLKGDFSDKTDQFFLPFVQQLDGGEFEMESLKQRGIIEAHIPYYCKGLTFSSSIVVVDEAEDLNEKQIRLIGTRLGENSRIFLNGDYKQSVINPNKSNALIKMCECLKGKEIFGTIYLGEDVRSTTSKLFSQIFE